MRHRSNVWDYPGVNTMRASLHRLRGTLTGLGGNLNIIDDPLNANDAMSETVRAKVIEWYRSTLLSRGDNKKETRIVLVTQRVRRAHGRAGHAPDGQTDRSWSEILN